jgi:hypothetical protein
MLSQEVLKRPEQFGRVFHSPILESIADIIDDHRPNGLAAVRLVKQVICERGSGYLRHMLMLADRSDFFLVETAKVDTILQRNHPVLLRRPYIIAVTDLPVLIPIK